MQINYDPTRIKPEPRGGLTLSMWKGPKVTFRGAGAYEVPDEMEQHPDWDRLLSDGAIAPIEPPAKATKPAAKKSTSRSKDAPDLG